MDDVPAAGDVSLSIAALEFRSSRHRQALAWAALRKNSPLVARVVHRRLRMARRMVAHVHWHETHEDYSSWHGHLTAWSGG